MKYLLALLLAFSVPSFASGSHTNHPPSQPSGGSSSNAKGVFISAVVIGAVVCIVNECWKSNETKKEETGSSMVPDNANSKETLYGVEINGR